MGLYASQVVPRVLNWAGGAKRVRPWRLKACEGLAGAVVEIGFGAGHNLPLYPTAVATVYAVEPSALAWRLAAARVESSPATVTRVGLVGESIPLADATCDAALMTFTLCTVAEPHRVLGEVARLVRPGGTVHFLEHGLAPDARVARWQRRLDPWQGRLFDGCRLTRDPRELMEASGLEIVWSESSFAGGPRPWTYVTVGVARSSG